ncbi:MAG: SurA N-terminal domain-containing protein [Rhodobacter sp.]|nr:SurA N-terminal domain-containing protein [Rhodobacter sp.]
MATKPDPSTGSETVPKRRKGSTVLVWVLMALLIAGLGGFGVTNFGGGTARIATVGDRPIEVTEYARALQQELQAFSAQLGQPVTMEMAQTLGLDSQVRRRLITAAALDNEAARIGLSVGDARVVQEIMANDAFKGVSGAFDRETYRFTLERNNLTEPAFETRVREDLSRSLLQGAVAGGFTAPAPMVAALQAWIAETRGFTLLRLTEADLPTPLPDPTDADLRAFYDANPALFTAPEARRITYAALLPEMLSQTIQLDEAALRAAYDERIAEFVQPERRLVERLVFPTDAGAAAAKARLDAGETFEALVEERGLTLADIDLGEQSREDLGAAGDAVFALTEPGVTGPLPSDLGPALYRMNGILVAQTTAFEDAREALATEQMMDAARRAIADRVEELDDLLAGGATLEDLAREGGLELGTVDYAPGVDAPIAGYEAFRTAAAAAEEGDFPELIELEDGGLVALRLDAIIPPRLMPFDSVAEDVATGWRADALARALSARAIEVKAAVEGGASPGTFGIVDVTLSMTRNGFVEGAPDTLLPAVFEMAQGGLRVIEGPGFVGLVRLDRIEPAPTDTPDALAMKAGLAAQLQQALAQDAFEMFATALIAEGGITINDAAIAAVHAQVQ